MLLSHTELSSQEWCELALDFTLRKDGGIVEQTAPMAAGSERCRPNLRGLASHCTPAIELNTIRHRHEELDLEVNSYVQVTVSPAGASYLRDNSLAWLTPAALPCLMAFS